jgi:hypothetical protein
LEMHCWTSSDGALDPILRLTIAASKLSFSGSLSSIG